MSSEQLMRSDIDRNIFSGSIVYSTIDRNLGKQGEIITHLQNNVEPRRKRGKINKMET